MLAFSFKLSSTVPVPRVSVNTQMDIFTSVEHVQNVKILQYDGC